MAIAVDGSTPIRWNGTPNNNVDVTSASFTPPAGALLVLTVESDTTNASDNITLSASDSLSGSWTNQVEHDPGDASANGGHASIWTRLIGSSAAMTVSVRRTAGTGGTQEISCKCYVVTGQGTSYIGANNEGHSTTNNLTTPGTTSQSNGLIFAAGCDWNTLGSPTSSDLTNDPATYSGKISVISGYKTIPSPGTSVTVNLDAAGSSAAAWNWVVLEILPPAGGMPVDRFRDLQPILAM